MATELIGMVVDGRYRLDATLGRGGMGLVYRATHIGLRRQVAVKILHPSLAASPDVRSRFEREALAVGKVDHPNCVATYDVGRLPDGSLYLAMELLEGKSLADVLEQEGQLAPGRALHILAHILRGLGSIHAAGLIHRDIKPENIFLIRQGDDMDFAKILDFGIAKPMSGELSDDGVKLTQAGMAFGTPIYMAPEQALGNPMDGRADLYAAAVIGYEMLCGQPPFYSEDKLEVMSMHTAKPVPPMRNRLIKGGKPVPSSIEKLILRGLTKKPGDRYAHAPRCSSRRSRARSRHADGGIDRRRARAARRATPDRSRCRRRPRRSREQMSYAITGAIDEKHSAAHRQDAAKSRDNRRLHDRRLPRAHHQWQEGGGVGIGLPYTGPSGEPIFGLTPEQRLAQAKKPQAASNTSSTAACSSRRSVIGVAIAILTAEAQARSQLEHARGSGAARCSIAATSTARSRSSSRKRTHRQRCRRAARARPRLCREGEPPLVDRGVSARARAQAGPSSRSRPAREPSHDGARERSRGRPERVRSVGRPHQGRGRQGRAHQSGRCNRRHRAPSRRAQRPRSSTSSATRCSASRRTRSICRTRRRARNGREAVGKLRAIGDPRAIPVSATRASPAKARPAPCAASCSTACLDRRRESRDRLSARAEEVTSCPIRRDGSRRTASRRTRRTGARIFVAAMSWATTR